MIAAKSFLRGLPIAALAAAGTLAVTSGDLRAVAGGGRPECRYMKERFSIDVDLPMY